MKKFISFIFIFLVAIIIGSLFWVDIKQNQYVNIESDNLMWNLYDINIQGIKKKMDPIIEANDVFDWYSLKEINIKDKKYEELLKEIAVIVSRTYVELEDDNVLYTDSNYIKVYREKNKISNEELSELKDKNKRNNLEEKLISNLRYYKEIEIEADKENKERLLNKIDEVLEFGDKYLIKEKNTYSDFVYNEVIETEMLKEMSKFLNDEYYRLS